MNEANWTWLEPRTVHVVEGYSGERTVKYPGVSVLTNEVVKAWDGTKEVSADILSTTVATSSGNVLTMPTIENLTGDKTYVLEITVTEDGNVTRPRRQELRVYKPEAKFGEG